MYTLPQFLKTIAKKASFGILVAFFLLSFASFAHASTGDNVTGYAWSSNIGWLSFNCTSQPGGCTASPGGLEGGGTGGTGGGTGTGGAGGDLGFSRDTLPFAFFERAANALHQMFAQGIFKGKTALADDIGDMSGSDYGVSVDPTTGVMSGYAWSPYIGWVSFNAYAGCPSGSCTPMIDLATNELHGWAKATEATGTSGWDGWISLNCLDGGDDGLIFPCSSFWGGSNYKVTYDPASGNLNGYAWGDDVVGWLKFSGDTYAVHVDLMQPVVSLNQNVTDYCPGDASPIVSWTTSGVTSCTMSASNGDPAFTGPVTAEMIAAGSVSVTPSAPATTYTLSCTPAAGGTAYTDSVTITYGMCPTSKLILSADPTPAQCATGYHTNLTLYSPSSTTFSSCSAITSIPGGAPIPVPVPPNPTNSFTVNVPSVFATGNPTTFNVSCTEADGTVTTASTTVARSCEAPVCQFTDAHLSGDPLKANLTWTSSGGVGAGLAASDGWTGTKAFNSSQSGVGYTSPQTKYSLTATNPDGISYTCSATLNDNWCTTHPDDPLCTPGGCVDPDPNDPNGAECDLTADVSLNASPTSLPEGGGTTHLSWTSNNITHDSCVGYSWPSIGSWNSAKADDGAQNELLTTSTTFRIECDDPYHVEDVFDDVTVTVLGTPPPPPVECTDPALCPEVRSKPWYIER